MIVNVNVINNSNIKIIPIIILDIVTNPISLDIITNILGTIAVDNKIKIDNNHTSEYFMGILPFIVK